MRVGRRQVSAHRADDRASGVCDGVFGVGVLEGRAGAGVLRGLRDGAVVVDDGGVVVGDFGVGDGAAGFGVGGVVVRVVGGEDGGGCSDDGADLLGGHCCGAGCGCCCMGVGVGVGLGCEGSVMFLLQGEVWFVYSRRKQRTRNTRNKENPTAPTPGTLTFGLVCHPW